MWILFALLSAISAAAIPIFSKLGLNHLDSTAATTLRSIIMTIALVGFALATGKFRGMQLADFSSREWSYLLMAGLAGAISWLCYFAALRLGPATPVAGLDRLSVVFVLIFAALFLGDPITWKSALAIALMTSGGVLLVLK